MLNDIDFLVRRHVFASVIFFVILSFWWINKFSHEHVQNVLLGARARGSVGVWMLHRMNMKCVLLLQHKLSYFRVCFQSIDARRDGQKPTNEFSYIIFSPFSLINISFSVVRRWQSCCGAASLICLSLLRRSRSLFFFFHFSAVFIACNLFGKQFPLFIDDKTQMHTQHAPRVPESFSIMKYERTMCLE